MVAELAQDLQLKPDDVTKKLVRVSVDIFFVFIHVTMRPQLILKTLT